MELVTKRPRFRVLLESLSAVAFKDGVLIVSAPAGSAQMARDHAGDIADLAGRVAGRVIQVEVVAREGAASAPAARDAGETGGGRSGTPSGGGAPAAVDGDDPEQHPLVRLTAEVFGARVMHVERRLGDGSASGPGR
ncbi:MAG: hypothetical protein CMJ31_10775 [Phycisphaerae bacterium]|nr:hypothetical protein [Phycisphaerae bacterium]